MIHELIDGAGALHLRARAEGAWSAWSSPADAEAVAEAMAGIEAGAVASDGAEGRVIWIGNAVMAASAFTPVGTRSRCLIISGATWSGRFASYSTDTDVVIAFNADPNANGVAVIGTTASSSGIHAWLGEQPGGSIRIGWVVVARKK